MSENKIATTVYAESTPNPKVMKFVANRAIIQGDSVEFMNIDEAKNSPLAMKLFHFPFVSVARAPPSPLRRQRSRRNWPAGEEPNPLVHISRKRFDSAGYAVFVKV